MQAESSGSWPSRKCTESEDKAGQSENLSLLDLSPGVCWTPGRKPELGSQGTHRCVRGGHRCLWPGGGGRGALRNLLLERRGPCSGIDQDCSEPVLQHGGEPGAWPSSMCHWAENRHTPWARMDATLSRAHQNAELRGPPRSTLASPRPAGPVGTGSAIPSRGQCVAGGEVFAVTSFRFLGGKECMTITRQREAGMSR